MLARGFIEGDHPWETVEANQIFRLRYGKALVEKDRRPGSIPVYGTNGRCGWNAVPLFRGPGVILGRKGQGPLGVEWCDGDYWVIDTAYTLELLTDSVELKYAYYMIKFVGLNHLKDGTSNPTLSRDSFGSQGFPIPPMPVQREIVRTLDSLDDKIALLRETNTNLEAIAQALFKSWFVDFDPVRAKAEGRDPVGLPLEVADLFPSGFEDSKLGTIPTGWKVEQLGPHLEVLETGRRPKGGVGSIEEGIPSIGAESIFRVGEFDYAKTKFVSHEFFDGMRSGKLESRDVLLYKDGGKPGIFLPRVSMFGDGFPFDVCGINEHVFRIRTRSGLSQSFLYYWLWSDIAMHELKHRGGKAAIPGINQADVREVPVLVPGKLVLDQFNEIADALISRILSNAKEVRTYSELRDSLLPRLMSGRITVNGGDK